MGNVPHDQRGTEGTPAAGGLARRAVLRAAGASAALSLGAGGVTAAGEDHANGGEGGSETSGESATPDRSSNAIDPVFGLASAGPNPCGGDVPADCLAEFRRPVRPSHEVEMLVGIPESLLLIGQVGPPPALSSHLANVNAAVADGTVEPGELDAPDAEVTVEPPAGESLTLTIREVAETLARTHGFHYGPTGLHVAPGDVVVFSAETPDHGVSAYHERHGRQNRVPEGAEPLSAPIVPVGGYWLYRFDESGVYDLYCPPHQTFGMVMRVVVHDGSGEVPSLDVENTGRPPEDENAIPSILGGLDPNLPSSREVLESDALAPERIVDEGSVPAAAVIAEHRGS